MTVLQKYEQFFAAPPFPEPDCIGSCDFGRTCRIVEVQAQCVCPVGIPDCPCPPPPEYRPSCVPIDPGICFEPFFLDQVLHLTDKGSSQLLNNSDNSICLIFTDNNLLPDC